MTVYVATCSTMAAATSLETGTQQRRTLAKKRVRFCEETSEILSEREGEDINSLWLYKSDYHRIQSEVHRTLVALRQSENIAKLDPEEYCTLGLERYLSSSVGDFARIQHKQYITFVVSQQSLFKVTDGDTDSGYMRVLHKLTSPSKIKALMQARQNSSY